MAAKTGGRKKPKDACSVDAGDKESLVEELKKKNLVLESELQALRERLDALESQARERARAGGDTWAVRDMQQLIMNNIPQGIFWKDRLSTYIGCNNVFAMAVGLESAEDIVGRTDYDLPWSPEQTASFREYDRRIMENDAAEYHIIEQMQTADGTMAWVETSKVPLHDAMGNVIGILGTYEDITERKRAEEELRESEEKFRQMAENIGEVFFIFTPDWKQTIYVSPAYERVWGRPLKEVNCNSLAWLEGVHPDDRGLPLALVNKNIGGDIPDADIVEFRVLRPDGTVRWILARTYPVLDEQGEVCRITGIAEDITDRKHAENELSRLASLVESSDDAIISKTLDGTITSWNRGAEKMYGYAAAEVVGRSIELIVPDDRLQELLGILERIDRGEPVEHFETARVTKDGRKIDVSITVSPMFDAAGKVIGASTIARDITERKRAEESLRESEERFKTLIHDLETGVLLIDGGGKLIVYNPALLKIFKISEKELRHMTIGDLKWDNWEVVDDDGKILSFESHPVQYAWLNRQTVRNQIIGVRRYKYDEWVWMLVSAEPLINPEGNINLIVCTFTDITQLKNSEDALKQAKQQAELYLDLMGHDINNMHQIALGYLELARDMQADDGESEFLDKPIEVLQRSARLIQNVRKLQKLRDGVFQTQEVDVCKMLTDVQMEFGDVPRKVVTLDLDGCERCPVRANELLHDVFANLVSNAIKHTGEDADIAVDLRIIKDGGRRFCRITVEDDGPGIPDDFKGKIFNRMLKGTSNAKGMGLGLYLVKSLVESYDGRVWVEDRVQGDHTKGARFVVLLPSVQ
jgi:PAS domain S-box-containing protein